MACSVQHRIRNTEDFGIGMERLLREARAFISSFITPFFFYFIIYTTIIVMYCFNKKRTVFPLVTGR